MVCSVRISVISVDISEVDYHHSIQSTSVPFFRFYHLRKLSTPSHARLVLVIVTQYIEYYQQKLLLPDTFSGEYIDQR